MSTGKWVIRKPKPTAIISHSALLLENFQFSSQEFYTRVEKAVVDRKIPDIKFERVEWPEGGILSARREYLRITRGRQVFDVCGAPFGTGFFVSSWFGEKPRSMGWVVVVLALAMAFLFMFEFDRPFQFSVVRMMHSLLGLDRGQTELLLIVLVPTVVVLFIIIDYLTRQELDACLCRVPFLGYVYANLLHRVTYYRIDSALMYQQAVHNSVMQVVSEIAAPQGIKPTGELESKPALKQLLLR